MAEAGVWRMMTNMRKLMMWLLCLMLLAALPLALADGPGEELLSGVQPQSLVWMEGQFYLLTQEGAGQQVARLKPGQRLEPWLTIRPEDALNSLMAADGLLYGYQQESGRVARLEQTGVSWLPQELDTSAYRDARYLPAMAAPILQGGHVYKPLLINSPESEFNELALYDQELETGRSRVIQTEGALAFVPYKEGELLVLRFVKLEGERFNYQLAVLDVKGGGMKPLPMEMPEALPYGSAIGAIGYDAGTDRVFYAGARQLMASTGQKPFERVGLLPFENMNRDTALGFAVQGGYAVLEGDMLVFRKADQVVEAVELHIQGHGNTAALSQLRKEHPDILPVLVENEMSAEDAYKRIQGGDQQTDIYILRVDNAFRALIDKGYGMDLSSDPAIGQEAGRLAPVFQRALANPDGKLCAWPAQMNLMSTQLKRQRWQQLAQDQPLPRSWGQLIQAFERHAAGDQAGESFFAYPEPEQIVQQLLSSYILQYEQPGEALSFGRPSLKAVLEGLARGFSLQPPGQQVDDGSETGSSDYLVFLGGSSEVFGVPGRDNDGFETLPPFVFEEGEQPRWELSLRAAIINPHSQRKEAALAYLRCLMQKEADPTLYYASRPEASEPYPDPDFEFRLNRTKEQLGSFDQKLKQAEAGEDVGMDTHFLRQRVEEMKADLQDTDRLKWLIPVEAIAAFREKAPWLATGDRSLLLGDQAFAQVKALTKRYAEGSLSLDNLLGELDQWARLVYLEQR